MFPSWLPNILFKKAKFLCKWTGFAQPRYYGATGYLPQCLSAAAALTIHIKALVECSLA
jgi:hypothetical protein